MSSGTRIGLGAMGSRVLPEDVTVLTKIAEREGGVRHHLPVRRILTTKRVGRGVLSASG